MAEKTSKQTCDCDIFNIETLKAFLNGPLYMDAPLLMELAAGNAPKPADYDGHHLAIEFVHTSPTAKMSISRCSKPEESSHRLFER